MVDVTGIKKKKQQLRDNCKKKKSVLNGLFGELIGSSLHFYVS